MRGQGDKLVAKSTAAPASEDIRAAHWLVAGALSLVSVGAIWSARSDTGGLASNLAPTIGRWNLVE